MPDFDQIRKELLRDGVNRKLLWDEYVEQCRREGANPLMYSQFCYYIQQDEQKRRATMHIPRKPGQQVEVDWAGDLAHVIDRDTGESIKVYVFVAAMSYSAYAYAEGFLRNISITRNGTVTGSASGPTASVPAHIKSSIPSFPPKRLRTRPS